MKILIFFKQPLTFYALDEQGEIVESGAEQQLLHSRFLKQAESIVGVVEGDLVTIKQMTLPIKQRRKLIQALPFALENEILGDIEDQHLSLIKWGNDESVYVSICQKALIEKYQQWAKDNNFVLTSLIPDFALFRVNQEYPFYLFKRDDLTTVIVEQKYLRSVCDNAFLMSVLRGFASRYEQSDQPVVLVEDEELFNQLQSVPGLKYELADQAHYDFKAILRDYANTKSSPFELLTNEYTPASVGLAKNALKYGVIAVFIVLLVKFSFDHWLNYKIHSEMERLTDTAQQAISEALPDMRQFSSLSTASFQLEQQILALTGNNNVSNEFMYLLQQLTQALTQNNSSVNQLTYRNNALIFNAQVAQYSMLQNLEESLRSSGDINVRLISTANEGTQVNARYEIMLK